MTQKPATASTRTSRSARSIALRLAAVALLLSVLFVTLIGPPAPSEITIYTGPEGSMFSEGGPDYAEALARNGIEARLVETQGSLENLDSLVHGHGPRVGFAESALIRSYQRAFADSVTAENEGEVEPGPGEAEGDFGGSSTVAVADGDPELKVEEAELGLKSLGALYLEPFWVFVPAGRAVEDERELEGLLVFGGREGSGTRVLAEALLRVNGLDSVQIYEVSAEQSEEDIADMFRRGDVEALFTMGSPRSPVIQQLLLDPRIRPLSFDRAEAYDRRFDFVTAVSLPEGTIDFEANIPPEELKLLASSIQLVAPDDLNPVLVDALLDAASEVHKGSTLFSARGSYPNGDPASLPLDPTAERFYSEGFAKWRSYVPFWLATWVDRFAVAVGALAAAGFFLSVLPRVVAWPFGLLLNRMTRRIIGVEQELSGTRPKQELLAELEAVDAESAHLWVPPTERVAYLEFRQLIDDTRSRVEELPDSRSGSTD